MSNTSNPRVLLDWGCFTDALHLTTEYANRPLLLASPRAVRVGWTQTTCKHLAEAGTAVPYVAEVPGEPTVDLVDELSRMARQFDCDSVIAIGGGAVIDAAKAVGATARSTFSSWLLTEWGRTAGAPVESAPPNFLPVIAIPTMAAAGSEANGTGVLINREEGTKAVFFDERLQPVLAIVDPSLCVGVPAYLTWAGALDIAAHAAEGFMSDEAPTEATQQLCTNTIRQILGAANIAIRDPQDRAARTTLSKLAIEVWNGSFNDGGTRWPLHAIAHVVGARLCIPHSSTVAMLMISWVLQVRRHYPQRWPDGNLPPFRGSAALRMPRLSRLEADLLAREVVTTYGDGATLKNSFPLGVPEISELLVEVFGAPKSA